MTGRANSDLRLDFSGAGGRATRRGCSLRVALITDDELDTQIIRDALSSLAIRPRLFLAPWHFEQSGSAKNCDVLILEQSHDLQAIDPFLARILKDAQHTRLILLAKTPPTRSVVALMKAGVECVLDKPVCGDALRLAVIRAGATEDSQDEGTAVQAFDVAPGSLQVLTAQQRRVAELIYQGKSNRQIADLLSIAVKTVECHRRQVMQRLEVRSAAALVRRLGEFKSP